MDDNNAPGAEAKPGISQADHDRAVNTARAEGEKTGAQAATDRFAAIIGAEGVKGDGRRVEAAVNMAVKYPAMSAEDIAAFAVEHVSAVEKKPSAASLENRPAEDALGVADAGASKSASILANRKMVTGY